MIYKFLLICTLLLSCFASNELFLNRQREDLIDNNTCSNFLEVKTIKFDLDWKICFTHQQITGNQTLTMKSQIAQLEEIRLDVYMLNISTVLVKGENASFEVKPWGSTTGHMLKIKTQNISLDEVFDVKITYAVYNNSKALSFMQANQTSSKTQPYLFSQCEPVECRALAPFQDTPAVKAPYTAKVSVPKGIEVYMSANKTGSFNSTHDNHERITFTFELKKPIPSYLLAIAAGNLTEKQVGPRSYVISEPDTINFYSQELSDLEKYLITLEDYIGEYSWDYYKLLVLPPSFPYGGMENPLLTFASPSIIVGDKSGISVAIHEIAHSWTGNEITHKNWSSFWITEGFTRFLERKAKKILFEEDIVKVDEIIGNFSMFSDMQRYGMNHSFSSLFPQLQGGNPNDAFSSVPYDKGYQFVIYLEKLINSTNFQQFMRAYRKQFQNLSLDYLELKNFYIQWVTSNVPGADQILQQIDWQTWIFVPGLPPVTANFSTPYYDKALKLAKDFIQSAGSYLPPKWEELKKWAPDVQYVFLQSLYQNSDKIRAKLINLLDQCYQFSTNNNKEIKWRWFQLTINAKYDFNIQQIHTFLGQIGRMKMIRPLYQGLVKVNKRSIAIQIFNHHKNWYHPVARDLIAKDLNITISLEK